MKKGGIVSVCWFDVALRRTLLDQSYPHHQTIPSAYTVLNAYYPKLFETGRSLRGDSTPTSLEGNPCDALERRCLLFVLRARLTDVRT